MSPTFEPDSGSSSGESMTLFTVFEVCCDFGALETVLESLVAIVLVLIILPVNGEATGLRAFGVLTILVVAIGFLVVTAGFLDVVTGFLDVVIILLVVVVVTFLIVVFLVVVVFLETTLNFLVNDELLAKLLAFSLKDSIKESFEIPNFLAALLI